MAQFLTSIRLALAGLLPPWQNRRAPWAVLAVLLVFAIGNFIFWSVHVPRVAQGLDAIKADGRIVVLTRMAPTTYYLGTEGQTGFEYLATQELGKKLGVKVEYRFYDSVIDLLADLRAGKGHIAATGLLVDPALKDGLAESPGYQSVSDIVVCRRDRPLPKNVDDLIGKKIWVSAGTSAADRLLSQQSDIAEKADKKAADAAANVKDAKEKGAVAPATAPTPLTITAVDQPVEVLLSAVESDNLDCTAANSIEFKVNNPFYPDLVEAFSLGGDDQLTWLFAPGSEDFAKYTSGFITDAKKSGLLADISRRFFGFLPPFDYVDVQTFNTAIDETLPDYEKTMRDAARETGLPWQLIAAVSYQESHWKPDAKSHTGVRGIMMLTEDTATHLGVENRLDPIESILAGARYIADLRARIPDGVEEPDRLWFALAAYNMGFSHLLDARSVAESMGLNKNHWTDIRRAMSVMSDPSHAAQLKSGAAQGGQALRFVQQVRAYQHILEAPR